MEAETRCSELISLGKQLDYVSLSQTVFKQDRVVCSSLASIGRTGRAAGAVVHEHWLEPPFAIAPVFAHVAVARAGVATHLRMAHASARLRL